MTTALIEDLKQLATVDLFAEKRNVGGVPAGGTTTDARDTASPHPEV